jgi:hypothetical protein
VRTSEDPTLRYQDEAGDWDATLPALRAIGVKRLAELTGIRGRRCGRGSGRDACHTRSRAAI